jgi:hypothetical protein
MVGCYVEVDLQQLWWSLLAADGWNTYTSLCSWKVVFDYILSILVILSTQRGCLTYIYIPYILFRNSAATFRGRNVGGIRIAHTNPVYQNCRLRREM